MFELLMIPVIAGKVDNAVGLGGEFGTCARYVSQVLKNLKPSHARSLSLSQDNSKTGNQLLVTSNLCLPFCDFAALCENDFVFRGCST